MGMAKRDTRAKSGAHNYRICKPRRQTLQVGSGTEARSMCALPDVRCYAAWGGRTANSRLLEDAGWGALRRR
jgi:hypothetical protein